jgi:hypothetical protein
VAAVIEQDAIDLAKSGIDKLHEELSKVPTEPAGETRTRAEILVSSVASPLFRSALLRQLAVDAVNSVGKHTLKMDTPPNLKVNNINWKTERNIFVGSMASAFVDGYGIINLIDDGTNQEIADSFVTVGGIIDNLRSSRLVGAIFNDGIIYMVQEFEVDQMVDDELNLDLTDRDGDLVYDEDRGLVVSLIDAVLADGSGFTLIGKVIGELFIVSDTLMSGHLGRHQHGYARQTILNLRQRHRSR